MGRRCKGSDLDRTCEIFAISPLLGVVVVLTHIAHATPFVVPISSVSTGCTPAFIGFPRGRAAIKIPIQLLWNGLRRNTWCTTPLFNLKATLFHSDCLRVFQQSTGHDFMFKNGSLVFTSAKPTKGSNLKDSTISLECVYNGTSFGDETRHGFFAQDIHPGLRRGNGNTGVPMWGGGDGDQIQVLSFEKFTEVLVDCGFSLAPGL